MMHKIKQRGFTLIELLVVIAIIGILSSVVLASLNTSRQKSRDARRIADMGQLQLALELYFDSCREYPATLALTADNGGNCNANGVSFGDFIAAIPTDPTSQAYTYAVPTGNLDYVLEILMEDENHVVLTSDLDGTVHGVACDDTVDQDNTNDFYCVGP